MQVKLLWHTPTAVAGMAGRICWNSFDKGEVKHPTKQSIDELYDGLETEFLDRIANKYKHESVIEHIVYSFYIGDIPRFVLQELARHRMASLSVKSTRYTLKELKDETNIEQNAEKYAVLSGDSLIDDTIIESLENTAYLLRRGRSNDEVKFSLTEAYKTELLWTINARSLRNFLNLRDSKSAHRSIRELAQAIKEAIPEEHKFLFNS